MASAASPLRRRPGAVPAAALAALAVLVALAALAVGRATPGGLQDHGPAQPVTPPLVPQPLWSGLAASPPPTSPAAGSGSATQAPPQPVPDVTVPGRDITTVDVRAVLAKDPEVSQEERRALDSCATCEVRSPEFRDLTGDGRPELIAAVATPTAVVLHVYTQADDRLLPILRVQVLKGFSAETVGTDLWLHEPTTVSTRTNSHYHWDGVRLSLLEQQVEGIGPILGTDQSGTGQSGSGPASSAVPESKPSVAPGTVRPPAPVRPSPAGPEPVPGAAVPSPRATVQPPARPTSAPPEAKP
ncbi:hypothetical protein [Kitasatospora aureofaciens]|uniref:hypothetical protein n=1 Tax=Kitasatospora aureofaciens TaxID=1894 RepID=UPI001C4612E0|nr:hypothetical protein [Kitasatospora aureofaciens]MBV6697104.1 hypothetical protein [Kitasatospora aureofaciens]